MHSVYSVHKNKSFLLTHSFVSSFWQSRVKASPVKYVSRGKSVACLATRGLDHCPDSRVLQQKSGFDHWFIVDSASVDEHKQQEDGGPTQPASTLVFCSSQLGCFLCPAITNLFLTETGQNTGSSPMMVTPVPFYLEQKSGFQTKPCHCITFSFCASIFYSTSVAK